MSRDQQQGTELLEHHNNQWIIDWPTCKQRSSYPRCGVSMDASSNMALRIFHKLWNPLLQSFVALNDLILQLQNDTRLERARSKQKKI